MLKKLIRKNKTLYDLARKVKSGFTRRKYKHFAQISNQTHLDRYPEIFRHVASYLAEQGREGGPVLSYGCSTGEECFSLRKYLDQGTIVGLDINKDNLQKCREKNTDANIHFAFSDKENLESNGPYQAIFAMSVLCRWPDTEHVDRCESLYPFSRFEEDVAKLDRVLKAGGLLILYNANFRFTDAALSRNYSPVTVPGLKESGFVNKFSRENQKLRDSSYAQVVFRKH